MVMFRSDLNITRFFFIKEKNGDCCFFITQMNDDSYFFIKEDNIGCSVHNRTTKHDVFSRAETNGDCSIHS